MSVDPGDMLKDDLEKVSDLRSGGMDTSIPALMELAFGSLAGLTALLWIVALFWVPDPITGQTWMGLGALGGVLFGLPAGAIFMLRRGGAEVLMAIVRESAR